MNWLTVKSILIVDLECWSKGCSRSVSYRIKHEYSPIERDKNWKMAHRSWSTPQWSIDMSACIFEYYTRQNRISNETKIINIDWNSASYSVRATNELNKGILDDLAANSLSWLTHIRFNSIQSFVVSIECKILSCHILSMMLVR
jgi:hypothetical protein